MSRRTTTILFALSLLAAPLAGFAASLPAQDTNVAGDWTLTVETPNGSEPADLTFVQEGKTITGTVDTPQGQQPLEGAIEGNDIVFTVSADMPDGGVFTVEFAGTVEEGTKISGTVTGGDGEFSAPFVCEKKEG